jgi:putative ABC transport system ATP-binding protein
MSTKNVLEASNLGKSFGERTLWSGLSFSIGAGHMVSLTGPSGSGKSTLLNCVGLLEEPTEGSLKADGRELTAMNGHRARLFRKNKLGYLFQDYALIDNASIEQNLNIAVPDGKAYRGRNRKNLIGKALDQVGMSGREREPVFQLSGGEQQRVALARLIVKHPSIILADEPTGALDHSNADMVIATLHTMAEQGGIVLIATHSDQVASACDMNISLG